MTIRKAKKTEWHELQLLNNEVFIDNFKYDPDLILDWALTEEGKKYFQELVNNPTKICFVAEDENGKSVGYIAAGPKEASYRKSKYIEIENMGVIPEYRSKGIGEKLMRKCLEWANEHGFQKAFVNSYFDNVGAISFYKNCGFGEIDVSLERSIS